MQFENPQELPINDSMRDDMVFKVSRLDPWYVNIVNFMVAGYIPPGEDKKKLVMKVVSTYEICHTSLESVLMACSKDVYRQRKTFKPLKDDTHHHMEDIMGVFCTHAKIWQSGFCWPTMYEDTKYFIRRCGPCQKHVNINSCDALALTNNPKLSSLMSGELTIWDHSQSQRTMSTSWW
jgi:hypothetical protein